MELTALIQAIEDGLDIEFMDRPDGWTEEQEIALCYREWMHKLHCWIRDQPKPWPDILPSDLLKYEMDFHYNRMLRG